MPKKKFSSKEKRAYYIGFGAAMGGAQWGFIKKGTKNFSSAEKKSFNNGFDDFFMRNSKKEKKGGRK